MDTLVSRLLFSDPDFALLARELKDPLRAAGALLFVWQGTQQKRLVSATKAELIACFPLGYRGVNSAISALIQTGWLREISDNPLAYEVRGNLKHVAKKAELSQQNRIAALKRWQATEDAQRMRDASTAHAPASANDAQAMPSSSSSSSSSSKKGEGERAPPPPPIRTMVDAQALLVTLEQKLELFEHYQTEHHRKHGSAKVLVPPDAGLTSAARVLTLAGRDMDLAKAVVTKFVESRHEYWRDRNWAFWLLENGKSFEQARLEIGLKGNSDELPF